jgi:tagatose 6-phosphate kinase
MSLPAEQPSPRAVRPARLKRLVCVAVNASIDKIAAVDRLVPGRIHRPELLSVVAGGKPINVARAAWRLALGVVVVPVIAGNLGSWLEASLAREGITARPVRIPGETRTCLSILDRSSGLLTELYEAGPTLDDEGWAAIETAVAAELASDAEVAVVVLSGSLPPGAPVDGYARLVRLAAAAGARTAVDADGELLARAVAAGPWLAKGNAAEAAHATGLASGGEADALAAAVALQERGATTSLVSRGIEGAIAVDEAGTAWRAGPSPERGAYPVGSGDAALAGFLAAIANGATTAQAARSAVAAGTANALRPGQAQIDPGDIARILPRVALEAIASAAPGRGDVDAVAGPPSDPRPTSQSGSEGVLP